MRRAQLLAKIRKGLDGHKLNLKRDIQAIVRTTGHTPCIHKEFPRISKNRTHVSIVVSDPTADDTDLQDPLLIINIYPYRSSGIVKIDSRPLSVARLLDIENGILKGYRRMESAEQLLAMLNDIIGGDLRMCAS